MSNTVTKMPKLSFDLLDVFSVVLWRRRYREAGSSGGNPPTLQPEQSGGVGSILDRATPLEHRGKESRTRLAFSYFCRPSARD